MSTKQDDPGETADKLDWRLMAPVFAIVAIDAMGMGVILPLLPFYAERFGATPFIIGILFAAYSFCQFVAGPLLGAWSDRIGRKPILIASQLGTSVSFVLLALANSMPLLFIARILGGLTSGNLSVASAYAVDRSSPRNRKQAIGIVSAGIGIGLVIGPALSTLSAHVSPTAPIWIAAALSAISMTTTMILLPADRPEAATPSTTAPTDKNIFSAPVLAILGLLSCFYVALGMVMGGLAIYLAQRFTWQGQPFGAAEVGIIFTGTGIINIFVQLVLMKYVGNWFTDKQLVVSSFLLLGVGYASTGVVQAVALLGLGLAAAAFGSSLLRPTLTSALSLSTPPNRQGMVLGVNQSLMAAGNIIGPMLGGVLLSSGSPEIWLAAVVAFYVGGVLTALACFTFGLWPNEVKVDTTPIRMDKTND